MVEFLLVANLCALLWLVAEQKHTRRILTRMAVADALQPTAVRLDGIPATPLNKSTPLAMPVVIMHTLTKEEQDAAIACAARSEQVTEEHLKKMVS